MANKRAVLPGLGIKIVPFLLRLFPARVHPGGGRPASSCASADINGLGTAAGVRFGPDLLANFHESVSELTRN